MQELQYGILRSVDLIDFVGVVGLVGLLDLERWFCNQSVLKGCASGLGKSCRMICSTSFERQFVAEFGSFEVSFCDIFVSWGHLRTCLGPWKIQGRETAAVLFSGSTVWLQHFGIKNG